jgi:hypothetical protein
VYTTDLSGAALTMSVTQTDQSVQMGMWGKVLVGTLQGDRVTVTYRDDACFGCSPQRPFSIDMTGLVGERQIHDIDVHMYQAVIDPCDKTYRGTCAMN